MNVFLKFSIPLIVFFCFQLTLIGQSIDEEKSNKYTPDAETAIIDLSNGTLAVRLVSKSKNITALNEALENDQLSETARYRLEAKLNTILRNQRKDNLAIVEGLSKHYNFSNYKIFYDTATTYLKNRVPNGYFLDNNLEVDPNISIDTKKPIFILKKSLLDHATANRKEAMIITDIDLNEMKRPFPYFTRIKYPFAGINAFFGSDYDRPNFDKLFKTLNYKLFVFHKKSLQKTERNKLRIELNQLKTE